MMEAQNPAMRGGMGMNPFEFPDRVEQFHDGQYCWSYDTRPRHHNDIFLHWLKIAMLAALPFALVLLLILLPYRPVTGALCAVGLLAFVAMIQVLNWKVFYARLEFRMGEEEIETWPKPRHSTGIYPFKGVRRVRCVPDRDLIELKHRDANIRVYVPQEDYELVQEFIRSRVPEGTEFVRW